VSVASNQPANFKVAQIAQLIEGLELHLTQGLRQGLHGQRRELNAGQAHLCVRGCGRHRHRHEKGY